MFDIYLYRGFTSLPNLEDFYKTCPVINNDEFQRLILEDSTPCFLRLNMNLDVAKQALKILIRAEHNVHGLIYPIRYRDETPKYTVEMAYPIAEKVIKEMQKDYPETIFSPIKYVHPYNRLGCLTFMSVRKDWFNEVLDYL